MKKPKRRHRGHLVIAFLLFALMGGLITLAHLRPPLDLPDQEPQEITSKRLDQQNNAWFTLEKAAQLVPEPPPPLQIKDEEGWPTKYEPKENSVAYILSTARPDDDPLLIEYIQNLAPARERALEALQKPYFLQPPYQPRDSDGEIARLKMRQKLYALPSLFSAEALRNPCSDDPAIDACQHLFNAWRIIKLINTDGCLHYYAALMPGIEVILKASPQHRQRMAEWLAKEREQWRPPINELENALRRQYAATPAWLNTKIAGMERITVSVILAQEKRMVRRLENQIRQAAAMTYIQFDQFRKTNPDLDNYRPRFFAPRIESFLWHNTASLATFDGLAIALALQQFKQDTGTYPDTLHQLVPAHLPQLPISPFTGKPYDYKRQNDDYSLSCTGGPQRSNRFRERRDIFTIKTLPKNKD